MHEASCKFLSSVIIINNAFTGEDRREESGS